MSSEHADVYVENFVCPEAEDREVRYGGSSANGLDILLISDKSCIQGGLRDRANCCIESWTNYSFHCKRKPENPEIY